jgi:hypothetical protein
VTKFYKVSCATVALLLALLADSAAQAQRVQLVVNEAGRRVEVLLDGRPFTSYIWPTTLKKPTLFPLRSAKGTVVTRGYPLEPRKNERVDHPHHVGLWLNSGDVNGLDFWNNSDAIKPDQQPKMGPSSIARSSTPRAATTRAPWSSRPIGSSPTAIRC